MELGAQNYNFQKKKELTDTSATVTSDLLENLAVP